MLDTGFVIKPGGVTGASLGAFSRFHEKPFAGFRVDHDAQGRLGGLHADTGFQNKLFQLVIGTAAGLGINPANNHVLELVTRGHGGPAAGSDIFFAGKLNP